VIFLYLDGEDWVVTREGNNDRRTTGFKASEPVERVLAAVREAAPRIPVLVGRPPGTGV
jgi:hypothetical protein